MSPCQSLILTVDDQDEPGPVELGVRIWTDSGEALRPGGATTAVLEFWADEAELYILPGREFMLRYPRRPVGNGRVTEVLPL